MTTPEKASRRYDDEEVYTALREVADRVGQPPTIREYREHRDDEMPSVWAVRNRHQDADQPWMAALTTAGLDPDAGRHGGQTPRSALIKRALAMVAVDTGHWPSPDEYRDRDALPSVPTIYDHYDSWPEAIDAAAEEYPYLSRLFDEGPLPSDDVPRSIVLRQLGIQTASLKRHGASVVHLQSHTPEEIAAALVADGDYDDDAFAVRQYARGRLPPEIATLLYEQLADDGQ